MTATDRLRVYYSNGGVVAMCCYCPWRLKRFGHWPNDLQHVLAEADDAHKEADCSGLQKEAAP